MKKRKLKLHPLEIKDSTELSPKFLLRINGAESSYSDSSGQSSNAPNYTTSPISLMEVETTKES
jgi:hypothetical protein